MALLIKSSFRIRNLKWRFSGGSVRLAMETIITGSEAGNDLATIVPVTLISSLSNMTTILSTVQTISYFELMVHGITISVLGFIGIIGNCLSLCVFSCPSMRNSINCFFMGLTIIDMFVITSAILMFSLPIMQAYIELRFQIRVFDLYQVITPFVYPVGMIAQSASVYLTVFITFERYIVVCRPLQSRTICTYSRARKCVIAIVLSSTLYNISRFFEYEYIAGDEATGYLQSTHLRQTAEYISIYINWSYMIVMYVVPFSILLLFNVRIVLEMRKARRTRSRLNANQHQEESVSIMLLVIVCTFMTCNAPAMVLNIMETLEFPAFKLAQVSNALVVFNSSFTIVIYTAFCKRFRTILRSMFRCQASGIINLPLETNLPEPSKGSERSQGLRLRRNPLAEATLNISCECGNLDLIVVARALPSSSTISPSTTGSSAKIVSRRRFFHHISTDISEV